ncbi:MAG: DUF1330 domain-containing protein [Acidobacteriota bacterium]
MVSKKIYVALMIAASLLFGANIAVAWNTKNLNDGKIKSSKKVRAKPVALCVVPVNRTIEFKADKMYEFAMLRVKPEKQQQLMRYFGRVFPLAIKYGVRPVVSFIPESTFAGDVHPSLFFVNEWPSEEAFRNFVNDAEVKSHFSERDDALEQLINTHTRVQQSVSVSLKEGDVVELAALWIKPGKANQLSEYFEQAMPVAMKYGVKPLAHFQPIGTYAGDFMPQVMALNQWPSMKAFQQFVKDPQLGKMIPQRDDALSRMVVIHSKVHFEVDGR